MLGQIKVKVGQVLSCKYPQHGEKNILCNQFGEIESQGINKDGEHWLKIKRGDGSYRTLQARKMVMPVISD